VEYSVERAGHASAAGGVADDVAAAERKSVDGVWGLAEDSGGEVHWGRRGVLGEGGGDLSKVVAEYVGGRRGQRDAAQHEQKDDAGDGVRHGRANLTSGHLVLLRSSPTGCRCRPDGHALLSPLIYHRSTIHH